MAKCLHHDEQEAGPGGASRFVDSWSLCSWRWGCRKIGFWRLYLPVLPPRPPAQIPVSHTGLLQSPEHTWVLPALRFSSLLQMLLSSLRTFRFSLSRSLIKYPVLWPSCLKSSSLPSFLIYIDIPICIYSHISICSIYYYLKLNYLCISSPVSFLMFGKVIMISWTPAVLETLSCWVFQQCGGIGRLGVVIPSFWKECQRSESRIDLFKVTYLFCGWGGITPSMGLLMPGPVLFYVHQHRPIPRDQR